MSHNAIQRALGRPPYGIDGLVVTWRCLRPDGLCYSALPSARRLVLLGAAFGPPAIRDKFGLVRAGTSIGVSNPREEQRCCKVRLFTSFRPHGRRLELSSDRS